MDEYILVCRRGMAPRKEFLSFPATTPEDASETARQIIKRYQAESVREFPFAPPVVSGKLYRHMQEFDGSEFIKTTDGRPLTVPQA